MSYGMQKLRVCRERAVKSTRKRRKKHVDKSLQTTLKSSDNAFFRWGDAVFSKMNAEKTERGRFHVNQDSKGKAQ